MKTTRSILPTLTQPRHDERRTGLSRRELLAAGIAIPGVAGVATLFSNPTEVSAQSARLPVLDIAEWSYFWVGVQTAERAPNEHYVNGQQMYVEYQIPRTVRYPYPVVLVHGGGGQGTDWMSTPDGRRGWAHLLLEQGFMVYIVDRPGHGRSPSHPDLQRGWPNHSTLEFISGQFTPMRAQAPAGGGRGAAGGAAKGKAAPAGRGPVYDNAKMHNQWPGSGAVGTPELDQLVAAEGGGYTPGAGTGPMSQVEVWQRNGAEMVRKIGVPVIIMTHSAGGPFGMYVAEAEPKLVRGLIINEGAGGGAFAGQNRWGALSTPMQYDPPVQDPAEIKTVQMQPSAADAAMGATPYLLQAEPVRKLTRWANIDVAVYTAEASFVMINPGLVEYFKQAGVRATELRLHELGIHGNGHVMMGEKNNRETLKPIVDWMKALSTAGAPKRAAGPSSGADSTAMRLADEGHFWVGFEHKRVQNNSATALAGTTYVQFLKPVRKRSPYPVILVHGGAGQGTHYMGLNGKAGWAHYFVQAGYDTYVIDRPGHGRAVYHPDFYGEATPVFTFESVLPLIKEGAPGRWMGSADLNDPLVLQFQAGQNSIPRDMAVFKKYYETGAAQLLDKIGTSIILTHSMGGPWPYIAASVRPGKVKAILDVEGMSPFSAPWNVNAADLKGLPIGCFQAEKSSISNAATAATLKQAGCDVEAVNLKDKGLLGNSHFMMFEDNRKQVFDVIAGWVEAKLKIKG